MAKSTKQPASSRIVATAAERELLNSLRNKSVNISEVLSKYSKAHDLSDSALGDLSLNLVKSEGKPTTSFKIVGAQRVLVLSDVHVPYHSVGPLTMALRYGKAVGIDCLVLNGDFMDCHSMSRFVRRPDHRDFAKELSLTIQLLRQIREFFPKIRIIFKVGNHEERYQHFIWTKAPEFFNVKAFKLEELLELDELGIEFVDDRRTIQLGKLNIIHGHEVYSSAGLINIARTMRLKANDNILVAHFHRSTEDMSRRIRGSVMGGWSTGCLCDLNPYYMPNNNWNHGFADIIMEDGGGFDVINKKIIGNQLR